MIDCHVEEVQNVTPESKEAKTLYTPSVCDTTKLGNMDELKIQNPKHLEGGNDIEECK